LSEKLEFESGDWIKQEGIRKEAVIDDIASNIFKERPDLFKNGAENLPEVESFIRNAVLTRKDLAPHEVDDAINVIMGQATGYGVLQEFFLPGAEDITEVFVNPSKDSPRVFFGRHGRAWPAEKILFQNNEEVLRYSQRICDEAGRPFTADAPIVDAWMKDGSRIAVVGFKASPLGVALTIRKSPTTRPPMPLETLVGFGMLPPFIADFLVNMLVMGHANVGFFGRTDSGKTTFMRAIGLYIDPIERVFIAETSFEMYMPNLPNCINLVEVVYGDKAIVEMPQLCRTMNRNNPDRGIVGELRSKEIVAASQIASSMSGGFWTTGHAGDINTLRTRIWGMFMDGGVNLPREFLDEIIASMFNFVVFLDKETKTKERKRTLMSVVEVTPGGYRPIFSFDRDEFAVSGGKTRRWIYENPVSPDGISKLAFAGANVLPEYETVKEKYLYEEVRKND
jgi:pilus assembly protein CpaF